MFFDSISVSDDDIVGEGNNVALTSKVINKNQPGRMSKSHDGQYFQSEHEYEGMCEERKRNGYNSGMGEIFRKVAAITPIVRFVDDDTTTNNNNNENHQQQAEAMRKVSL